MTSATVMGVDLGTQGLKVLVYDASTKTTLTCEYETYHLIARDDGSREQNAHDWLDAFHTCLDRIPADVKAKVQAIGVSGQQHGFVPVDGDGKVLAPVKLWCDTSTTAECTEMMDAVGGEEECLALSGNKIAVGYTASKILWLKKNFKSIYDGMAHILLPHDYLNFYLTGVTAMEYGDASGTGLLDVKTRRWCKPLLKAIDRERDLMQALPSLIEAHESVGTITPVMAARTGLPETAIVSAGGGDNMMAAIGTGNVKDGMLTASLGTSGTLFGYSSNPIIDSQGDLAAFCASTGGWLPLLCTMNCTVATERVRDLINVDVAEIEALAGKVPVGADGVLTLPYYNGERTPNLPDGKAVIYGLDTTNSTKGHLLRSAMEAAIFGLKTGLEAFSRCGMHFDEVTLTGGGSASPLWRQICADILGLPVRLLEMEENAAFGAALQALWAHTHKTGNPEDITSITEQHLSEKAGSRCEPIAENVKAYEDIFTDYLRLVATLTPLFKN